MKRTEILNALLAQLVSDGVVLSANAIRKLVFLHECNDFPSICMYTPTETRTHYGRAQKIGQISTAIRGYAYNGDDPIGEAERLARSIEISVDAFARSRPDLGLYEARVLSVRTDEGSFAPHAICDITVQITYEV